MLTFSLQSGSSGNSIYVEAGETRLLIDAGISGRQAKLRLAEHQRSIADVDALLITHDHNDHSSAAGVYQRLFKFPAFMTRTTHEHIRTRVGKMRNVKYFAAGESFEINDVLIHTLPTPHDAVDGVAFIIEHAGKRLGVFTDLGWPFAELAAALEFVDAAYLESNYDPEMLRTGPYSLELQDRIRGDGGHLSNEEAAELRQRCNGRHRWITLAHLSAENNHPDVARRTHAAICGEGTPTFVAPRFVVSEVFAIE